MAERYAAKDQSPSNFSSLRHALIKGTLSSKEEKRFWLGPHVPAL